MSLPCFPHALPAKIAASIVIVTAALAAGCGGKQPPKPRVGTAACPLDFVLAYGGIPSTVGRVAARAPTVGTVVLGGAGVTYDQKVTAVRRLQALGIRVLDYAYTRRAGRYDESTFGTRPLREVRADIATAERSYRVDGIFVDNVPPGAGRLPYFRAVSRYIRSLPGRYVVFNGARTSAYLPLADVLVEFEGTYGSFLDWRPPGWTSRYPASRFAAIVHGVPGPAAAAQARALARRDNAGNVFITDAGLPSPYSRPSAFPGRACTPGGAARG